MYWVIYRRLRGGTEEGRGRGEERVKPFEGRYRVCERNGKEGKERGGWVILFMFISMSIHRRQFKQN